MQQYIDNVGFSYELGLKLKLTCESLLWCTQQKGSLSPQ